jgi:hypothetical protein
MAEVLAEPDDAAAFSDAAGDVASGWAGLAVCVPALAFWAGLSGLVPDASGVGEADGAVLAVLLAVSVVFAVVSVSAVLAVEACLAGSVARSGASAPGCDPGVLFDAGFVTVGAVAWPVFCTGAAIADFADVLLWVFAEAGAARVASAVVLSGACAAPSAAGAGTAVLPGAAVAGAVPGGTAEAACAG